MTEERETEEIVQRLLKRLGDMDINLVLFLAQPINPGEARP